MTRDGPWISQRWPSHWSILLKARGLARVMIHVAISIGAMELLIDKPYGTVYPEPGPNMMWNAKYGMMAGRGYRGMMGPGGGMMGPGGRGMMGPNSAGQVRPGAFAEQMTVSPEQAREIADAYVRRVSPGTLGAALSDVSGASMAGIRWVSAAMILRFSRFASSREHTLSCSSAMGFAPFVSVCYAGW
jgi:hypothetical protein